MAAGRVTVTETCSCGATYEATFTDTWGSADISARRALAEFRKAHEGCLNPTGERTRDPSTSPFPQPEVMSGYPLDPEEQAVVDRVASTGEDNDGYPNLRRAMEQGRVAGENRPTSRRLRWPTGEDNDG